MNFKTQPFRNWDTGTRGGPLLIDVRQQIVTRVTRSQPFKLRQYAWTIRRFPRLAAARNNRAMIVWAEWRTAAPRRYKPEIQP